MVLFWIFESNNIWDCLSLAHESKGPSVIISQPVVFLVAAFLFISFIRTFLALDISRPGKQWADLREERHS